MSRSIRLAGIVAALGLFTGADLLACGDKFLVAGRGTRYQRPKTARAANVLIFDNAASGLPAALEKVQVDTLLKREGHSATRVESLDQLSAIIAGVWRMADWRQDVPTRVRWIEQVLDLGITSFDHADIYGNYAVESLFGEALAAAPGLRERLQIITKCGILLVSDARPAHAIKSYDSSRAHVIASVEASLRARGAIGGTAPEAVRQQLAQVRSWLAQEPGA